MRADVFCNDNPIGTIDWTPDACGVQVNLDCAVCGNELLRCYAVVNGNILRVGLPAPEHGRLRLHRHLSRQMLHETGCEGKPERFYLASVPEPLPQSNAPPKPPLVTGDTVLDALLSSENVQIQPTETGLRLQCRSHWRPPLYFAAQKEIRQFWNGKRTQPMRLRPLKRRNFTLRWSLPPCSSASRAPHPWRRSCAAERRRKRRRGTGRSWRCPAG